MVGTLLNIVTVIIGSLIGMTIGNRLSKQVQESIMTGLGLIVVVVALQNAFKTGNILIPLVSIVVGAIIGELIGIEAAVKRFGSWLQTRVQKDTGSADETEASRTRFITGFVTSSILFCVGPMTVIGSVQNGINPANIELLALKSTLDLFASMAFASSLGLGVAFSAVSILVVQGGLALVGIAVGGALIAAGYMDANNPILRELTATGGIMLLGIALTLLDLKQPRNSNYLPALIIAPLLVLALLALGVKIYP